MTSAHPKIAFFGHDSGESTIVKRVEAFRRENCEVTCFMFCRSGKTARVDRSSTLVDLGVTQDRNYIGRLPKLLIGLLRALRHRSVLRSADVVYARNIDMLGLAWLACVLSRSDAPLVYEVLDVQRVFTTRGRVGEIFRWIERALLSRCRLLVVSSQHFIDRYFGPVQGRDAGWILLENKVGTAHHAYPPPAHTALPSPWRIGWFGTLRCRRSLDILCQLADRLAGRVEIVLGGRPSHKDLTVEAIKDALSSRRNIRYIGSYESPIDLPRIYEGVHFSWCVDYLDDGANSDWLVPNRIYEGGLFGAVAMARAGTATGDLVDQRSLGFALAEPMDDAVAKLLAVLDAEAFQARRAAVIGRPIDAFVDRQDTASVVSVMRSWGQERRAAELSRSSAPAAVPVLSDAAGALGTRSRSAQVTTGDYQ